MATKWISPTWRMPEESNQSKFENYSLEFPGTGGYVTCTSAGDLFGNNEAFTFSFWCKVNTMAAYKAFFDFSPNAGFGLLALRTQSTSVIELLKSGASLGTYSFSDTTSFHNFCIVYDKTDIKLYIDNVEVISSAQTNMGDFTGLDLHIANGYFLTSLLDCNFSDVCLFKYAASSDQRSYLYNSGTPQNPMAISGQPPVAYYPLGGSSTGSSSTLTIPNESVPSATVFDFGDRTQSEYIGLSQLPVFNSITTSAWIKTQKNNATIQTIISNSQPNAIPAEKGWLLDIGAAWGSGYQKGRFVFFDSTGSTYTLIDQTSTQILVDNEWHHIVALWDGTTTANAVKIFVDGLLAGQGTSTFTGPISQPPATFEPRIGIGGYSSSGGGGGNVFGGDSGEDGFISNVQTWDTALTYGSPSSIGDAATGQIAELYNNGVPYTGTQPQAANLKGWWKMNVDTSTWNGTDWLLSNSSITPTYTEGLFFGGSYIGGSPVANYAGMRLTNQTISSDHVTHSFWYKRVLPTTGSSDDIVVPGSGVHLGTVNVISSGTVQWVGDGASKYINFSGNVADGAWHHVLVYYPNGTTITHADIECYIDGTLQTNSYIGGSSSAGPVTQIKGTLLASVPIQVELSNWAYFLTDQTGNINTIYNGGTPGDISSLSPSVWLKYDSATTAFAGATGANYGLATDSSGNSNNGNLAGRTDGTTTKLVTSNVQSGDGISNGMTTANLVNSDLTRSIPYSSYSMVFDGLDDYISFPADASLNISTANHSMSFWLKTTDSGICVVSQKAQDELATWIQSSKIKWAAENPFSSTSNINDGTWKHICFVADGSSSYIYINGVLDATGGSQIRSSASGSAFAIGSRPGSFPYDGSISNWGLFNKALTEDQILTIYNGGVPNSISSLSPVSWWSLAGDSYFDGNDFICPDLGSGGNNGTSSGMGGAELVGNGPGSTANGTATSMDIPANLKGNAPNSSKNAFSVNMTEIDRVSGAGNVPG